MGVTMGTLDAAKARWFDEDSAIEEWGIVFLLKVLVAVWVEGWETDWGRE